jgi:phytoene/squalene synthetase
METYLSTGSALAQAITRAASKQTYYTIRFLVDRTLVEDAYRAYAYFRWVDDWLDQELRPRVEQVDFIKRQQDLIDGCYRGSPPRNLAPEEYLLADLIQRDTEQNSGLQTYIHNMMAIMAFDARRCGRLVTQRELNDYTYWLATAVTECMHYFIGHDCATPQCENRYQAVTGAHITHMLRDAVEDVEMGYYNIPRELLAANGIAPWDVSNPIYRDWVKERVNKARLCFLKGRDYLSQVENLRCRIAGYSYIRRFEIVLDSIERDGYLLRADYPERKGSRRRIEMVSWAMWMSLKYRRPEHVEPVLTTR